MDSNVSNKKIIFKVELMQTVSFPLPAAFFLYNWVTLDYITGCLPKSLLCHSADKEEEYVVTVLFCSPSFVHL